MNKSLNYVIAACITSLMLVWPVMFTIGLRYSLAGLLILTTFFWWYTNRKEINPLFKQPPVLISSALLGLLSLWFVIQALWVVPDAHWVWRELRSQWLKDIIFWILGLTLGIGSVIQKTQGKYWWLLAVVSGLLGIVFFNVGAAVLIWIQTGQMPTFFGGATGSRTLESYVNNMLLAFLMGDLLARDRAKEFLPWKASITIVLIAICLVNTVFIGTRHGWIGVGMLTVSGFMIYYIQGWRRVGKKGLFLMPLVLVLLAFGAWTTWKTDHRWVTLKETLPIAWDIDTHKAWIDHNKHPFPTLPNGQVVDASNYERPAWIHAGLRMVANRPFGAGFSRHAFGHEIARLYPDSESASGMHAHSSIIDLAVGGGIPAVLLWTAFVFTLIWCGGVAYFRHGSGAGLLLVFLTSGFFGRSLLDSVMRDHSMEQYIFIVAFLLPMVSWDLCHGKSLSSLKTDS